MANGSVKVDAEPYLTADLGRHHHDQDPFAQAATHEVPSEVGRVNGTRVVVHDVPDDRVHPKTKVEMQVRPEKRHELPPAGLGNEEAVDVGRGEPGAIERFVAGCKRHHLGGTGVLQPAHLPGCR